MRSDKQTFRLPYLYRILFYLVNREKLNDVEQSKIRNVRREIHAIQGENPIYSPRRKKFKGYQRENRRSTFNKNR